MVYDTNVVQLNWVIEQEGGENWPYLVEYGQFSDYPTDTSELFLQ